MAHGRPLSRHGRYDAPIGMPLPETESTEFYRQSDYSSLQYASTNPHTDYNSQIAAARYDQYARISTPREEPPAHSVPRKSVDNYGNHYQRRMSLEGSEENFSPSPPSQPMVSPDSSYKRMYTTQPRPPSASSRPQSSSSRMRSARLHKGEPDMPELPPEDLPEMSTARPPSSFSKYRLLPAIGTPVPDDTEESPPINHLYNVIRSSSRQESEQYIPNRDHHQQPPQPQERHSEAPARPHLSKKSNRGSIGNARVSSAVSDVSAMSDVSVISSCATSRSQRPREEISGVEVIERLDLSQLDKPEGGRRRRTSHPSNKSNTSLHQKPSVATGDFYDGDDDDSDSVNSPVSKRENNVPLHQHANPQTKKPVVIPSQDQPTPKEILLAVKLPTDGSRHQRYFNSDDTLQTIVDFAEEVAGQDFGGYILVVASAPKNVYVDLQDTIENAGLEDKTVLHLEEYD